MGKNKIGTCEHCGRRNTTTARGLCMKHYKQLLRYGKFLDDCPRNKYDPNEIIKYDNYAELLLYNQQSIEIDRVKIDLEDIELLSKYKWHRRRKKVNNNEYDVIITNIDGKEYSMHRLLMDAKSDEVVMHKNKDYLDNRKENLEIVGKLRHLLRISSHANTSGTVGVYYKTKIQKWCAEIYRAGKSKYLGSFRLKEDAIKSRKRAERKYRI